MIKQNPDQAQRIALIFDQETRRKLSNEQFRSFLGNSEAIDGYLTIRRERITQGITPSATDTADIGYDPYANASPQGLKNIPKALRKPVRFLETIQEHITRPIEEKRTKIQIKIKNTGATPFGDD